MSSARGREKRAALAPATGGRGALAVAAFLLALAYLWPLRGYGLNVEDEGNLLLQITRVARGELPYVDFSTGYTPGFFALNALVWHVSGDLLTFRTFLAVLHAGTVAALAALLAGVARPVLALALPVLYLVYIPLFPGEFCAFNIAYPAWFATAGWLATAAAMLAFTTDQRRRWLVAAGCAAAVTLAMKPNAGVLAFAAAAASVLSADRRGAEAGAWSALVWGTTFVGILLGVALVLGGVPRPLDAAIYLLPLVLAMGATVTWSRIRRAGVVGDLAMLGLPLVVLSAPWLVFFWRRLGTAGFLREVLLIGSGAADIFYVPFPVLEPWGVLLSVLVAAYAAAALLARRWLMPQAAFLAIVAAVVAMFVAVARLGVMPEGWLWSTIWQLQKAAFALTLGTHVAGIVWLWRCRVRAAVVGIAGARHAASTVLVLFAILMHVQLYPRADFMHLLVAAPLSLVLAGFLLDRVLAVWASALSEHPAATYRAIEHGTAAVVIVAIGIGLLPALQVVTSGPRFGLPFAVAPVGVEEARAGDLRALAIAGERLAADVGGGAPTVGFPAFGLLLFLTGGHNPTPFDYFWAGRPDHREEAEMLDVFVAAPPPALTASNRQFGFFDAAQAYYFLLRRFVRAHYGLVVRAGRFDVLERGAAPIPRPSPLPPPVEPFTDALARLQAAPDLTARVAAIAALARHPADATASTLLTLAASDDVLVRRTAVHAFLDALARTPARGLETYVAASDLDRRGQILVLRTIRDLRDGRAASYLFAAAASSDPRLVREALGAMRVTRAEMIARRYLWAGPELQTEWPGREALRAALGATLAAADAPVDALAFAAHLAGALGDTALVAPLQTRMRAGVPGSRAPSALQDANTTASAADALATLAPESLGCELTQLLARPEAAFHELLPTILLALAEGPEPMRGATRRCLRDAIQPGPAAAPVLWVVAALADAAMGDALRAALDHEQADDRRAAAWALGELPPDPTVAATLADRARTDPDEIVRRLATTGQGKQAGQVPRVLAGAGVPPFFPVGRLAANGRR